MIEIEIKTDSIFNKNKSWWDKLSLEDRRTFYDDSGIQDLGFLDCVWEELPFPHQVMINRSKR